MELIIARLLTITGGLVSASGSSRPREALRVPFFATEP